MELKGYQALAHWDSSSVILSKQESAYRYFFEDGKIEKIFSFKPSYQDRLSRISRYIRRLLRSDIRFGFRFEDTLLLVRAKAIHRINISHSRCENSISLPRGNRPLNMTIIKGVGDFTDGLYFGEYFSNNSLDEVHIYQVLGDQLQSVYTFPSNTINHIHNLIADPDEGCVWILVGDFGDAAAIYRATDNFQNVEKVVSGSQQFRSCVAYPYKGGLLYATDSQFEDNHVRVLERSNDGWTSRDLYPLNGSCIYGTEMNGNYYFSTAVEAINDGPMVSKYLRSKRGPGIKEHVVEIVKGNMNDGFTKVYTQKKDSLPFILFQFGNIIFPSGFNSTGRLVFTLIGTVKNDFSTLIMENTHEI